MAEVSTWISLRTLGMQTGTGGEEEGEARNREVMVRVILYSLGHVQDTERL